MSSEAAEVTYSTTAHFVSANNEETPEMVTVMEPLELSAVIYRTM